MLSWFDYSPKTLIIADRGYESYNVFAHFKENTNLEYLIRVKQSRSAMREIKALPLQELDEDISFTLTTTQTNADKKNGYIYIQTPRKGKHYSSKTRIRRWDFSSPYHMTLRIVRIRLSTGEFETLATSLPRSISAAEIKELYHMRWGIETSFRELKYAVGLERLHGKSEEFAKQEVFAALTMANFASRVAQSVSVRQKNGNLLEYAVNRKHAVFLSRKYYAGLIKDENELKEKIRSNTETVRPDRQNERNLRVKSFSGFNYRIPT